MSETTNTAANVQTKNGLWKNNPHFRDVIAFPAPMKTFRVRTWNGKKGDFTCKPFCRATVNPDPSRLDEVEASEMGDATRLFIENGVEVWGWL